MTDVQIHVTPDTIRPGGAGPATGSIWIAFGSLTFPAKCWNDFVVVILQAWVSALVRLLRGTSQQERVHFMEGPYLVDVTRPTAGTLHLTARESRGKEKVCLGTEALPFIENLITASERTLLACSERNCWSTDADRLAASLSTLRSEAEKLRS